MRKRTQLFIALAVLIILGLIIPQNFTMPVKGATAKDYNQKSFWYYPWGRSGTHKGVDIFAKKGTDLNASTSGVILYTGEIEMGGKVVVILGPKWRIHYYAHLDEITSGIGWIERNAKIGTVGDSGNAKGKQPHVHYAIVTLMPHFWRIDTEPQGWKKMFYLNPITYLEGEKNK